MILGFYELPEEDRPPERIWKNPKLLSDHWDVVRGRQKAKANGMEPIGDEESGELQNPATASWRR